MEKKEIVESIRKGVAEQLGKSFEEVTADKKLKEDLGADSLDMVELMMGLEEKYNMSIADESLETIKTIDDVANYIVDTFKK